MEENNLPKLTEEQEKVVAEFLKTLAEGKVCPHCKQPIEKREQVGRCVYARPCGCRLYQGKLKK